MLPGTAEPAMTWDSIFFSCFSSLLPRSCVFAFEEYKWPFQIQDLMLTMTTDNTNFFTCEALFIQRALQLLFKTVDLPFIHHQNECTSKVEQRTHQCKVAVHSNLGQEVKNNVSHWRYRVKSSWQNTFPEWEPGQNIITRTCMLQLRRESAMGSSLTRKGQSLKFYIQNRGRALY